MASSLLTLSLIAGSIQPRRLGSLTEALLLATCVASGMLGVAGLIA